MGLLTVGNALEWKDSKIFLRYVKDHGIEQFINLYKKYKDVNHDDFYWGDELEYIVVKELPAENLVKVSHNGYKVIERFNSLVEQLKPLQPPCSFLPEYGSFMIESTPFLPYKGNTCDLMTVEKNMRLRRCIIESLLEENEKVLTTANFPLLGTADYSFPSSKPNGPVAKSLFISDESINPSHPRFACLTKNIRKRRGSKVDIRVPLYIDENTIERLGTNTIEMDAMAFGMGCCCLQVTLQAKNMIQSRFLYDQMIVLSPIFLALTASTPFHKGQIGDWDVRWNIISHSVDCRNEAERGIAPLSKDEQRIHQSRFGSVATFLALTEERKKYNNFDLTVDKEYYKRLLENGVDQQMARHVAHLFVRDPLVIFKEFIELDDTLSTNHFENIQSTNWQTCRLKPPTGMNNGWKVEFRAMEIQLTDFENAAFSVFVVLLSRAILFYKLDFYLAIDLLYKNMESSHQRAAACNQRFYFRSSLNHQEGKCFGGVVPPNCDCPKVSLNEIFNGNKSFVGLIKIVKDYLVDIACDEYTLNKMASYLNLVEKRASGELANTASWMRNFVTSHPAYMKDSVISPEICNDLLQRMMKITNGEAEEPELLGTYKAPERKRLYEALKDAISRKDTKAFEDLTKKNCNGLCKEKPEQACYEI